MKFDEFMNKNLLKMLAFIFLLFVVLVVTREFVLHNLERNLRLDMYQRQINFYEKAFQECGKK